eukprot:4466264-Karenia_brevis.AAC.1
MPQCQRVSGGVLAHRCSARCFAIFVSWDLAHACGARNQRVTVIALPCIPRLPIPGLALQKRRKRVSPKSLGLSRLLLLELALQKTKKNMVEKYLALSRLPVPGL